jgi:hypothetical protein
MTPFAEDAADMCAMRKKADLPKKICASCQLPFVWRKKWRNNWSDVRYCSERCRKRRVTT